MELWHLHHVCPGPRAEFPTKKRDTDDFAYASNKRTHYFPLFEHGPSQPSTPNARHPTSSVFPLVFTLGLILFAHCGGSEPNYKVKLRKLIGLLTQNRVHTGLDIEHFFKWKMPILIGEHMGIQAQIQAPQIEVVFHSIRIECFKL